MAQHNDLGKQGEEQAVAFLQQQGYSIRETNWIFDKAEIHIIAQKGNTLAVVEVKTRSSIELGLPQEFVTPKKIKLLVKAIDQYICLHELDVQVRFDIIAVHKIYNNFHIEHIEEAFLFF